MRDIKFRAWDGENMFLIGQIDFALDLGPSYWVRDIDGEGVNIHCNHIMQYTGLKDKHGKEIYEGDIVLTAERRDKPYARKHKTKKLTGVVKYFTWSGDFGYDHVHSDYECGWELDIISKEDEKIFHCYDWGDFWFCEVIGNIYETPELLNAQ